jgi:hypothetical protein
MAFKVVFKKKWALSKRLANVENVYTSLFNLITHKKVWTI